MKRLVLALAMIVAPVAAEQPASPPAAAGAEARPTRNSYANPSAVIAAELAFAKDAATRGQWTAFAAAAAPDAVMFTPRLVWAQEWLKGRPNPPKAVTWQTHEVWSSCDGTLVVSHGAWQNAPENGYFTTIWQRQPDGHYKWVLDHGDTDVTEQRVPEMIPAHVAQCPYRTTPSAGPPPPRRKPAKAKPVRIKDLPPLDPNYRAGQSADGTLKWEARVDLDGGRTLAVTWLEDGEERSVLNELVAAAVPAE
jgi:hypothetical protein